MKRKSQKIPEIFYEKLSDRKEIKRQKKKKELITLSIVFACIFLFLAIVIGIGIKHENNQNKEIGISESSSFLKSDSATEQIPEETEPRLRDEEVESSSTEQITSSLPETSSNTKEYIVAPGVSFDLSQVSSYSGIPFCEINSNIPYFTEADYTTHSYEYYSPLDSLGRCGYAVACIGTDLMPTEPRGEIGEIRPSGWHTVRYDDLISDRYLYNRCHLIAYQLAGENANPLNLITGTRYMNMEGMLPFENQVADYVTATGNHVLYRSTPIFEGENLLLATGVLLEAYSIEDQGKGICFNVFTYNIQPGITIDYATGESFAEEIPTEETTAISRTIDPIEPSAESSTPQESTELEKEVTYILNRNTKKFHRPTCSSVSDIKESNKVYSYDSREAVIAQGYAPCKRCNP